MLLYQKNTGRLVQNDNNNFICFSIRKIQEDWCKMIIIIVYASLSEKYRKTGAK
jgi:hypothetical protein